jgi:glutamate---cysteine ligase / carboxylate-amine ligase
VLTALTANSPFWQGVDTGYASYRSQAWHRWPSAGPTEVFADAAEYHRLIDDVLATGTVLDTGMVYFDARLSETWPTVEVRTADVALRVDDAVTLAGVVRGLVETAAREARRGTPPPAVRSEVLRVAAWRAGRSGLGGDLVDPRTGRPAPAADVLAALLDHIRTALADAGDERRVSEGLAALLRRGTGADLQRRVHRETGGDLAAVVRAAVAVTTGETGETARAATGPTG